MTLDDMIKSGRNSERSQKSRGETDLNVEEGPVDHLEVENVLELLLVEVLLVLMPDHQPTPLLSFRKIKDFPWQNGLFEDSLRAAGLSSGFESGAKLYVSNLHNSVTNEDISELFSRD
ncbi:unnamed protein product [Cuscuta epithymum]|uniref:Uncharacterized protein n=1 Tax=Cuscuta epithymum TaxID=186058 RepID=A0AAV0C6H5_9ASTE|nr:unnamed protein product [Cuscuta epithymum]